MSGLISGFMFAGMVFLLVERQPRNPSARIPALAPLLSGFIALGLCSYLFVLISGEDSGACRRIWSATAVSSGMLAAGTVAAVGGIVLIIHAYFDQSAGNGENAPALHNSRPDRLLRFTFLSVAYMSEILLLGRVGEALWVWLRLDRDWLAAAPAIIIAAIAVPFAWIAFSIFGSTRREKEPESPHIRSLNTAALVIMLYSTTGLSIIGTLLAVINGDWGKADSWTAWLFVVPSFVVPSAAIWLLAKGVLGVLDSWSTPAGRQPAPA
ncbi:hypothetical protein V6U90_29770 [Micromonospora sp. CPCC 206060]|uniref:hypothetical protein n=1 Tax=Micromonospora sp. CPCC 206060 TaxID=3122406 RepID=UPI002FEF8E66